MAGKRVPLKTMQERLGHAATGVFTLDVYCDDLDFHENQEAGQLLGTEIKKAVESASHYFANSGNSELNYSLTTIQRKSPEAATSGMVQ